MGIFDFHNVLSDISLILSYAYGATIFFIIILIIAENRSPLKSISWILVVTLMPIVGIVFYFFFGQQYRKQIRYNKKETRYRKRMQQLSDKQIKELSKVDLLDLAPELIEKRDIMTLLLNNDKAFISRNKVVKILNNGEETFNDIKDEIAKAKSHIHFEFYILKFDKIGTEIFTLLEQKALEGVEVRIIYDSVGSYYLSPAMLKAYRKSGIQIHSFQKVFFPFLSSKVNYRNHRKLVIIDGEVGYTGGLNIADRYLENSEDRYWRDTFVKIVGPAVSSMQLIFMNDWFYISKQQIFEHKYFVDNINYKENLTQIISSGPDSKWNAISQFYFSAITSSRKYIYISTPYFIPNEEISFALKAAALRGIDVRIMVPQKSDTLFSHLSGLSYFKEMLKAGVKIYFYKKGFCHHKIIISDDVLCSVGSANFDYRSLETNFEVSAVFYDPKVNRQLQRQFMKDLRDSDFIDYKLWQKRPWYHKFITSLARLFAPLF